MSDGSETAPVEFELEQLVGIKFNASDLVGHLTGEQLVELVKEIDLEANEWEATILLASYFSGQLMNAPPDLVAMSDEQLAARLVAKADMAAETAMAEKKEKTE